MTLPRENHSGYELSDEQTVSLAALEAAGKLQGWVVILSASPKRAVRVVDTAGAQYVISRNGKVKSLDAE